MIAGNTRWTIDLAQQRKQPLYALTLPDYGYIVTSFLPGALCSADQGKLPLIPGYSINVRPQSAIEVLGSDNGYVTNPQLAIDQDSNPPSTYAQYVRQYYSGLSGPTVLYMSGFSPPHAWRKASGLTVTIWTQRFASNYDASAVFEYTASVLPACQAPGGFSCTGWNTLMDDNTPSWPLRSNTFQLFPGPFNAIPDIRNFALGVRLIGSNSGTDTVTPQLNIYDVYFTFTFAAINPLLLPYMLIPQGQGQSINELDGQSSVAHLEVDSIDLRGELKRLAADVGAIGSRATFSLGFAGECLEDFVTLHTTQLTEVDWTADGLVRMVLADPQRALFDKIWQYGGPYQLWQPNTAYSVGQQIIDLNGNVQQCVLSGTSGAQQPIWQTKAGEFTFEGSVLNPWRSGIVFATGAEIRDPQGYVQQANNPNNHTSGAYPPTWNEVTGGTTTDGVGTNTFTWTNEGPQLTWRNLGQLQPPGPCFNPNADYISSNNPRWIQGNPIDIALVAYQNEIGIGQANPNDPSSWQRYDPISGTGLINPNPGLDVGTLLSLKSTQFSGDRFEFKLTSAQTAKEWVEEQILKPLGLYHIVRPSGMLSFKSMKSPITTAGATEINQDHMIGIPEIERWPVLNYVTVRFDSQDPNVGQSQTAASMYSSEYTFIDEDSADQYTQYFQQQVEAQGLRLAWGGYLRAWLIAQRIFSRHSFATPEYHFTVQLRDVVYELGDLILLSHPLVLDLVSGTLGIQRVLCEITDRQPNYANGTIEYKAADTRFLNYTTPYSIAGVSENIPAWTSASAEQKTKYMFICSASTLKYSDGTPGNTIF